MTAFPYLPLGPLTPDTDGRRRFRIWAPKAEGAELALIEGEQPRRFKLRDEGHGYLVSEPILAPSGTLYGFYLEAGNNKLYPDPASRRQPKGVHGPSEVVDFDEAEFGDWHGRTMEGAVIYEVHLGTFTAEGTLSAAIGKLDYLRDLGVNTIELMPLNQTPGDRNWGYDGVLPFALFRAYGEPDDLRKFIDRAHERGMAVIVDVIYNHLGTEGNYLDKFFPVFTEHHHTPWGPAINFDDLQADGVKNYWLQNVKMWLEAYGADGLRIDAVHAIKDYSATHFLEHIAMVAEKIGEEQHREIILIAECDLNAPRYVRSLLQGGYGMSGQWVDEFHHALHTLLTGEQIGYYEDFGEVQQLGRALRDGYVYTGQYSHHRGRNFGTDDYLPWSDAPRVQLKPSQFVVFLQNHDQVGNRMMGDRLLETVGRDKYLLGAATYLLSAFTPMIFMGEEYGETNPFPYFVHHGDPGLIEAVRKGRAAEFAAFQQGGQTVPDPQAEETFNSAILSWREDADILGFYKSALQLRAATPSTDTFNDLTIDQEGKLIAWSSSGRLYTCFGNYGNEPLAVATDLEEILLQSNGATLADGLLQLPPWGFAAIGRKK